jgi:hypothetical protein
MLNETPIPKSIIHLKVLEQELFNVSNLLEAWYINKIYKLNN